METTINNHIVMIETIYIDNIGYDLVALKDGKLIDVIGGHIVIYHNKQDFIHNHFPMNDFNGCIMEYADITSNGDDVA